MRQHPIACSTTRSRLCQTPSATTESTRSTRTTNRTTWTRGCWTKSKCVYMFIDTNTCAYHVFFCRSFCVSAQPCINSRLRAHACIRQSDDDFSRHNATSHSGYKVLTDSPAFHSYDELAHAPRRLYRTLSHDCSTHRPMMALATRHKPYEHSLTMVSTASSRHVHAKSQSASPPIPQPPMLQ